MKQKVVLIVSCWHMYVFVNNSDQHRQPFFKRSQYGSQLIAVGPFSFIPRDQLLSPGEAMLRHTFPLQWPLQEK